MYPDFTLFEGDCLEVMKQLPDKCIDMVLCDLPYGEKSRNKWDVQISFEPLWKQYLRIVKDNGAIVLFANGMFTAKLMQSQSKYWRYNLIWEKTQPTGFLNAHKMPMRCHEDICVFYKRLPTYNPQMSQGHPRKVSSISHKRNCKISTDYNEYKFANYDSTERYPRSVLKFAKDTQRSKEHSTQKPVALLEYLIKTYTNEGDAVLDNCMGSGSTGVATININRHFIGIEKDADIYKLATNRITETANEIILKRSDKNV